MAVRALVRRGLRGARPAPERGQLPATDARDRINSGSRIVRGALLPGDRLDFASEKYRVHLGPSAAAEAPGPVDRTEMISAPFDPNADTPPPTPSARF